MDHYLFHSRGRPGQPHHGANYYWLMAALLLIPALAYVAWELFSA
ncbi:hypothetical protein EPAKOI_005231 (plasmid) [Cupriavidus sp. H18C2]